MSLKKPSIVGGPAAKYLDRLSKAALIDVLIETLALANESADDPVTVQQCAEACLPTLNRRGDRIPSTDTGRKFTQADIGRIEQAFINDMNDGTIDWPAGRDWTLTVASYNGTTNSARWDRQEALDRPGWILFTDCEQSPLSSLIGQPVELGHDLWISTGDHAFPFHVQQPASGIGWTIVL